VLFSNWITIWLLANQAAVELLRTALSANQGNLYVLPSPGTPEYDQLGADVLRVVLQDGLGAAPGSTVYAMRDGRLTPLVVVPDDQTDKPEAKKAKPQLKVVGGKDVE
jgi:hypothetical protein